MLLYPKEEMRRGSVWGLSDWKGAERFPITGGAKTRDDAVTHKMMHLLQSISKMECIGESRKALISTHQLSCGEKKYVQILEMCTWDISRKILEL